MLLSVALGVVNGWSLQCIYPNVLNHVPMSGSLLFVTAKQLCALQAVTKEVKLMARTEGGEKKDYRAPKLEVLGKMEDLTLSKGGGYGGGKKD